MKKTCFFLTKLIILTNIFNIYQIGYLKNFKFWKLEIFKITNDEVLWLFVNISKNNKK